MSDITKFRDNTENIPEEFLVVRKDKAGRTTKFVTMGGLMYLLDQMGVYKIQTRDVTDYVTHEESGTCTVDANGNAIAPVTISDKYLKPLNEYKFEAKITLIPSERYLESKGISKDSPLVNLLCEPTIAHGQSDATNVSSDIIRKYLYVMAETRAVVRAMRLTTGCRYTAVDELGGEDYAGILVKSCADMLKEENKQYSSADDAKNSRKNLLIDLKKLRDKHEFGAQIVADYLDSRNKGAIENLDDASLAELIVKLR